MPLGSDTDIFQYRRIQFNGISLSIDVRDNCCILHNGAICILCYIAKHENTFQVGVRKYRRVVDIGIKSSASGLYKCSILCPMFYINPNDIQKKCYGMPFPNGNQNDNEAEGQERRGYCMAERDLYQKDQKMNSLESRKLVLNRNLDDTLLQLTKLQQRSFKSDLKSD